MVLPKELLNRYYLLKPDIEQKILEFCSIHQDQYFYELCFCICTPQSKASAALKVQHQLEKLNFKNNNFDPIDILSNKHNYIRFHNQKSLRLIQLKLKYPIIEAIILNNWDNYSKRNWLAENIKGIGYKEASHFLRNIGYSNLAILDRHILKNLVKCRVFDNIPKINTKSRYMDIEQQFINFANHCKIPMDHLDLLFWSQEAGTIIK